MRKECHSIGSELRQVSQSSGVSIEFRTLILKQQEVIASLQEEILMLKSYISLERNANVSLDLSCHDCSLGNTSSSLGSAILNPVLEDSIQGSKVQYQPFIKEMAEILDISMNVQNLHEQLLEGVRKYKEIATTPRPPVFVQRIKEIKVPITVEKIVERPVEKIVEKIVEKVVYVQGKKQQDRPAEKGLFREKVEGYRDKNSVFGVIPQLPREERDEPRKGLNKSYSEKNMGIGRIEREGGWERRYEGQKVGNNLKRRGGEGARNYRREYY